MAGALATPDATGIEPNTPGGVISTTPPAYALPDMIKKITQTSVPPDPATQTVNNMAAGNPPPDPYAAAKAAAAAGKPPQEASPDLLNRLNGMRQIGMIGAMSPLPQIQAMGKGMYDMAMKEITQGYSLENGQVVSIPGYFKQQAYDNLAKNQYMYPEGDKVVFPNGMLDNMTSKFYVDHGATVDKDGNVSVKQDALTALNRIMKTQAYGQNLLDEKGQIAPSVLQSLTQKWGAENPATKVTLYAPGSGNPITLDPVSQQPAIQVLMHQNYTTVKSPEATKVYAQKEKAGASLGTVGEPAESPSGLSDNQRIAVATQNIANMEAIGKASGEKNLRTDGGVGAGSSDSTMPPLTGPQQLGAAQEAINHPGQKMMINPVTNTTTYYDPLLDDANLTNQRRLRAAGYKSFDDLNGTDQVLYNMDNEATKTMGASLDTLITAKQRVSQAMAIFQDPAMRAGKWQEATAGFRAWAQPLIPDGDYKSWVNGTLTNQQVFERASGQMLAPILQDNNIKRLAGPELNFAQTISLGGIGKQPGSIRGNLFGIDQGVNQLIDRLNNQYTGLFPPPGAPRIHVMDADRAYLTANQNYFNRPDVDAARHNAQIDGDAKGERVALPKQTELPKGVTLQNWFDNNNKYWTPATTAAVQAAMNRK